MFSLFFPLFWTSEGSWEWRSLPLPNVWPTSCARLWHSSGFLSDPPAKPLPHPQLIPPHFNICSQSQPMATIHCHSLTSSEGLALSSKVGGCPVCGGEPSHHFTAQPAAAAQHVNWPHLQCLVVVDLSDPIQNVMITWGGGAMQWRKRRCHRIKVGHLPFLDLKVPPLDLQLAPSSLLHITAHSARSSNPKGSMFRGIQRGTLTGNNRKTWKKATSPY